MMRLIPISGKTPCRILEKLGFRKVHRVGSHVRYVHPDGRITVVPVHANENLGKGLLNEILNQIELPRQEYEKLRQKTYQIGSG